MALKLYVWTDVLTDYSSGIMFALAESADHAREIIHQEYEGKSYKEATWKGTVWNDLSNEPSVYDSAIGFLIWGAS